MKIKKSRFLLWVLVGLVSLLLYGLGAQKFGYKFENFGYKFVNIDPRDSALLSSDAIIETKTIKIPEFTRAYNPSIVEETDGYLMSFRVNSYNLSTYLRKKLGYRTSFLGIVKLDQNFNVVGKAQLIDVRSNDPNQFSGPEDARLIRFNGKIYAIFNDDAYPFPGPGSQGMFIAELMEETGIFRLNGRPKLLSYKESVQDIEKNWSPFVYQDKLYVVYSITPHTILEVNVDTGVCCKVNQTQSNADWSFGDARGGTPYCSVDDQYISFFHSCKGVYFMGAYTFESKPPFRIKKMTPYPLARLEDYLNNNPKKVVYPAGLIVKGEKIYVLWGQNDSNICLSIFDKSLLLSSMISY